MILCLATIPALIATANLHVNPRWTKSLPQSDPLVKEFLQVTDDPFRGSTVFAVIDGPGALEGAHEFSTAAARLPHVRFVHGLIPDDLPNALMFLPPEDLESLFSLEESLDVIEIITRALERSSDRKRQSLNRVTELQARSFAFETLEALALALEGESHLPADSLVEPLFKPPPGIVSGLGYGILVRFETDFPENSIDGLPEFVTALDEITNRILQEPPHTRIRLTGYPVTAHAEVHAIESSGKRLTVWALVIILLLMKSILGDLRPVLNALAVLIISVVWVMGLIRVVFGEMNTVTMIMGVVMVGLGIDFCIHWQNHRRHGLAAGLQGTDLERQVFFSSGTPILAGATTTAGAFLCVLVMKVPSLQEFAVLSAGGVMLTAGVVLLAMPIVESASHGLKPPRKWAGEWAVKLALWSMDHPRRVLVVFLGLSLLSLWSSGKLEYEYNYSRLQIGGLPSFALKQEIIGRFDLSSDILVNRVKGLEEAAALDRRLMDHPEVARVESLSDYLLPEAEHNSRARLISHCLDRMDNSDVHQYDLEDLGEIRNRLLEKRRRVKIADLTPADREDFERFSQLLRRVVLGVNSETIATFNDFNRDLLLAYQDQVKKRSDTGKITLAELPDPVKAAFLTSEPGVYLQYIFPTNNVWEKGPSEVMDRILAQEAPLAVGLSRISFHLIDLMVNQGLRMSAMALVVVLITLRLALKKWSLAALALVPLVLGGLLTVGTLTLLGVKANFYNLVGVPILLGIGIDDGVHIINAYRRQNIPDAAAAIKEIGSAVLLTSLTSMVGFGCLAFYRHPGMATLGKFLFVGIGWCLITTLVLLPVLLKVLRIRLKEVNDV